MHCYKGDNAELPFILVGAPGELSGSMSIMSRVDEVSLTSSFFLGGVPSQTVCWMLFTSLFIEVTVVLSERRLLGGYFKRIVCGAK